MFLILHDDGFNFLTEANDQIGSVSGHSLGHVDQQAESLSLILKRVPRGNGQISLCLFQ